MSDALRRRPVLWGAVVLLLLLVGTAVGWALHGQSDGSVGSGGAVAELDDSRATFSIDGDTTEPISPGVMRPIDLAFTNPYRHAVRVTDLRVVVRSVDAPRADAQHPCGPDDFTVRQVAGNAEIALGSGSTSTLSRLHLSRDVWPQVGMHNRATNQDGCKGASLTLAYRAAGRVTG
jgi:hypothetical protein